MLDPGQTLNFYITLMKKTLLFFACCLLLTGFGAKTFAQSNVIKINPLSLFAITGNIQYERALNEKMSVQLGGYFGTISTGFGADGNDAGISYTWYGITPEFRYYVTNASKDAPRGLYVGPFVRYRNVTAKYDATLSTGETGAAKASITGIGGGAIIGYQFLFGDVVALDLFAGPQYTGWSVNAEAEATGEEVSYTGLFSGGSMGARAGIGFGFAF